MNFGPQVFGQPFVLTASLVVVVGDTGAAEIIADVVAIQDLILMDDNTSDICGGLTTPLQILDNGTEILIKVVLLDIRFTIEKCSS